MSTNIAILPQPVTLKKRKAWSPDFYKIFTGYNFKSLTQAKIYSLATGVTLSQNTIAQTVGCSRKTVNRTLRQFEKKGILQARRRPAVNGKKAVVQYRGKLKKFHIITPDTDLSYEAVCAYFDVLMMVQHAYENEYHNIIDISCVRLSTASRNHSLKAINELLANEYLRYFIDEIEGKILMLTGRTDILFTEHDQELHKLN